MKYIYLTTAIILLVIQTTWADIADPLDPNSWIVTPANYENNMTVIAGLLVIDEDTSQVVGDRIAAFVGNDCRGTAYLEYIDAFDAYMVSFFIYGSGASETIEFWMYDSDSGNVVPVVNTEAFTNNASFGTFANPYIFEATTLRMEFETTNVLCASDNTGSITTTFTGGQAPYTINWNNGETNFDISDLAAGWYYATASDASGFTVSDSVEILNLATDIPPPHIIALPSNQVCKGGDAVMVAFADGYPDAEFNWYNTSGNLLETGNTFISPDFQEPSIFSCESVVNGCISNLSSVILDILELDVDFQIIGDAVFDQEELVRFEVNNPSPDFEYYWTFGDNGWSTAESPYYYYNLVGTFDVALTIHDLATGCSVTIHKEDYVVVKEPVLRPAQFEDLPNYHMAAFTYPNPFTNHLSLVLKPKITGLHRIILVDMFGREIQYWEHESDGSVENIPLEGIKTDLAKGAYSLFVESQGEAVSYMLLKK